MRLEWVPRAAEHSPASRDLRRAPDPRTSTGVVMVGLLLRSVRVFGQFAWLQGWFSSRPTVGPL
ncbi:MAG TPA: hypothetical protein VFY83_07560 [Anaerolineales bacterium]|nr:hypothetical protein [Anaerolineales bacterium]